MSDRRRRNELAGRRKKLQDRSNAQRAELHEIRGELQHGLRFVDRGIDVARRMTSTPIVLLVGLAALALVGPRGAVRWISRAALVATSIRRLTVAGSSDADRTR
jgi:hypothetical protein